MFIKRYILQDLIEHLSKKEISLIVGPRQAGKTTLMNILQDYLNKKGEKTLFLSLDFEDDMPFFKTQSFLVQRLKLEFGNKKGYVFIDEIQRKENAGLFLKGLYDMNLPYKFIVSGSGSVDLREKIHESLIGRKRIFELNTLSLKEFLNFKTEYKYEGMLKDYFRIVPQAINFFIEYINFGGYPRVILEETINEKNMIINEIFRSYMEKDISFLLKIERINVFSNLIKILSSQIGNSVNFNELATTLGASLQTIKNYIYYAEKTFVLRKITPFFRNVRKEISKSPVFYFNDLGLRNYAIGLFGKITETSQAGFLFQNLVYHLLIEKFDKTPATIHWWRTKDKAEVDFVIDLKDRIIPVEVKCKEYAKIERSLKSFIAKYKPEEAWVVNPGFKETIKIDNTLVKFLPFWEIIE